MQRRTPLCCNNLLPNQPRTHKKCPSSSTVDSGEGSVQCKGDKLKSQLCKRFMENGYCPYEKKCKFAHGSQQLRKNDQVNSKYKTKECGSFKMNSFCPYGDRCNFIHTTAAFTKMPRTADWTTNQIDLEMMLIKHTGKDRSRLLHLLQQ